VHLMAPFHDSAVPQVIAEFRALGAAGKRIAGAAVAPDNRDIAAAKEST
jgi:hypothetical protein